MNLYELYVQCTINSKTIIGTSIGAYLQISKQHSILAVANLVAQKNL